MAQAANASGLGMTWANGAPEIAKDDAGPARSRTNAAARAATNPVALASGDATRGAPATELETEAASTPVHVVDLKSWLPPAAPEGGSHSAARAQASTANAQDAATGAAPAAKDAAKDAAPSTPFAPSGPASAQPQAAATPALPSALRLQSMSGAAPRRQAAALGPATPASAANVSAPRRDLQITLEQKDLGGLAVRMKSTGDRLEIAFVADRATRRG